MVQSRFTKIKTIPNVSTGKSSPSTNNFADGISTYKPNDTMKTSELRLAQDARFDRIGEYKTRVGYSKLMPQPIGYTDLSTNLSSGTTEVPIAEAKPYTFTPSANALVYSAQIRIKNTSDTYAVPCISLWSGDEKIAETFLDPETITNTSQALEFVFMNTPNVYTTDTVEVRIGTQGNVASGYEVQVTSAGVLAVAVKTCTEGAITNIFEANINGTKTVLFTQNEKLYRMNSLGAVTKIRDLPVGTTKVRFNQDLNKVRYVDGKEGPRLLDPSNSWSDTAITGGPYRARLPTQ